MQKREVERMGSLRYLPLVGKEDQLNGFESLKGVFAKIMEIDDVVFRYAQALEAAQPPAPGKIAIRFLRRQWGGTDSRHPTFVQWFKSSSGRWLYERLKPNEVLRKRKGYSAFQATEDVARELLVEARQLIELREALWKLVGNTRRTMAMHTSKASTAAAPFGPRIETLLPEIESRREEIILGVRAAKQFAVDALHEEIQADSSTIPRIHPQGRTRGTRTVTRPRRQTD